MDLKAFWRDVIKKQGELEAAFHGGFVYLTSVDNREKNIAAGAVTEVTVASAARHLCERTHEISTPVEIEVYQARCQSDRARILAFEKTRTDRELRISVDPPPR